MLLATESFPAFAFREGHKPIVHIVDVDTLRAFELGERQTVKRNSREHLKPFAV